MTVKTSSKNVAFSGTKMIDVTVKKKKNVWLVVNKRSSVV